MEKNVGSLDKNIRYLLAAVLVLIALFTPLDPIWRIVLLILAAIAFVTAITGL
ncbi:YgaP family membrane protein [Desulfopila inferna]|uniref:YgaP family membrane protein n=1 Tax=Desulfopila inferna TaxID=468528 RepID=UPI0019639EED|nr:DUF2892 domain-containing protein [Desulfopila inferna]MBM9605648.1 DUF2892 domain-containing protein [Desulfopila inferna]